MHCAHQAYLPASNAGDAMGESSTLTNSCPSVGRLGLGSTTSHDTCPNTLHNLLKAKFYSSVPSMLGRKLYIRCNNCNVYICFCVIIYHISQSTLAKPSTCQYPFCVCFKPKIHKSFEVPSQAAVEVPTPRKCFAKCLYSYTWREILDIFTVRLNGGSFQKPR